MRSKAFNILLACLLLFTASCGTASKDKAILAEQAARLNTAYAALAQGSQFVRAITFGVDDKDLTVEVEFCDDAVNVEDYSPALVKYVLAAWLKDHTGTGLDETLNALGRLDGELELTLTDADGDSCDFDFTASQLKHMVRTRLMELSFNEARANVQQLMDARCDFYRQLASAAGASFRMQGGFAEYTLTFPSRSDYRQYTQAKIAGKFVTVLRPEYESYGRFRPFIEELLRGFQIDGYRFVYTDGNSANAVQTAIPWRLLN